MGILFIVSAPSGAGKTSILKEVLAKVDNAELSISYTTRAARSVEVDGVDYHFLSKAAFSEMIDGNDLLEYAEVFGNCYGTSKAAIKSQLQHSDVFLEIDWQGAMAIKELHPEAVWVFILPPSMSELSKRLMARNTNAKSDIESRLAQAIDDMEYAKRSDYTIFNKDFDIACSELISIIKSERLRSTRQQQLICDIIND